MNLFLTPLAALPENALVITVSVSLLLRITSLCCSCALLSVVIKNALPSWIVAAPRHSAALKPLLSIIPPEAITGILTTSATCGIRDMRPIKWSSPIMYLYDHLLHFLEQQQHHIHDFRQQLLLQLKHPYRLHIYQLVLIAQLFLD